DKSRHVYGLHLAKESIRKGGYSVLVEGNLDVISSHQAGVRQVVATAGTALTEPHLKALSRFSGDIRLCFYADKAGLAATERAIPIASKVKVSLSIIDIPTGKDPDELIRQDPQLWQNAIETHQYALDWLIKRYLTLLDIGSAQGKRQFSDVLLPVVRGLADDVERDHYLSQIATSLGVSQEALSQKYIKTTAEVPVVRHKPIKTSSAQLDKQAIELQRMQDNYLCLMLLRTTLREFLQFVTPDMLYTDQARELLVYLQANPDFDGKRAVPELTNLSSYVKILSLLYEELYQRLELNELHYEAARLQARLVEAYVKHQKQSLSEQLATATDERTRELLQKVRQHDELLKQVKGKN
ncbi:MAG: toprim domain-containing protein, partial [Candidatus Saccharimonadales bacterium]